MIRSGRIFSFVLSQGCSCSAFKLCKARHEVFGNILKRSHFAVRNMSALNSSDTVLFHKAIYVVSTTEKNNSQKIFTLCFNGTVFNKCLQLMGIAWILLSDGVNFR